MTVLGIETSCDETGVGIVRDGRILANAVATQEDIHRVYGGVMPELASRAHCSRIDGLLEIALADAGCALSSLDAIGVTSHPGLKGALLVGVAFAAGLGRRLEIPVHPVDHLHAHLAANFPAPELAFPALGLVVSGGHTSLFRLENQLSITLLGRTLDDACGETFDKVGRLLNLGFPGGPAVERTARTGDERAIRFPVSLMGRESLDFSFSGLKTSVAYYVQKHGLTNVPDICAGFQKAVGDALVEKIGRALRRSRGVRSLVLGGGVTGNAYLRGRIEHLLRDHPVRLFIPPPKLCLDNGAMVAELAWFLRKSGAPAPPPAIVVSPTKA